MATKKATKSTKQLRKAKKMEATKPLSKGVLAQGCAAGVHYTSATLY